jgi:hypothetical protein
LIFFLLISVCVKVIDKFVKSLDEDVRKSPEKVEKEFSKFCKNLRNKEERFVSVAI